MSRSGTSTVILAALAMICLVIPGARAAQTAQAAKPASSGWPVDSIGEPVHKTLSNDQAIGAGPDGSPEAFFVTQGNYADTNAEFAAVDLRTRKTLFDTRLSSGYGTTGIVFSPSDKDVYMAVGDDVFRYQPGTTAVEDLGPAISGEQIWSLSVAPNGTLYGGTYPSGKVFSYDPTAKAYHDYGQAVSGETYVTAVEPVGDSVYFGTQPNRKFGRLDLSTGTFTEIPLPAADQGQEGDVGFLSLRGDDLFVGVDGALVWNVSGNQWTDTIGDFNGSAVSPPDPGDPDSVYFRVNAGDIVRYHMSTRSRDDLNWAPNASPGAFAWVDLANSDYPGETLVFTYYTNCRVYGYNVTSGKTYYLEPQVQGAGDQLIALGEGPDGDVYAGGFQTPPGMGQWDPDTKRWNLLAGSGQVEGYGEYKGNLVFGRYPQGSLYYDDLSKPWNIGTNPGNPLDIGNEQNRPVAFADLGDQVAVGSVPASGRLGGAISLWKPDTGALAVYRDVVQDQTPVTLVNTGGLVWGGTSIDGGYGINPTATSAELFAWDPATHQTVFHAVPLGGATNISSLVPDGSGHLWGLADGTLFEFDPAGRRIMHSRQLYSGKDGSMYGLEDQLVFDHGRLFGTYGGHVFHVDTTTWATQTLFTGTATNLTQDRYGQLYFVDLKSHVYRYDLPGDVTAPQVRGTVVPQGPLRGPKTLMLFASDGNGVGVAETDCRIDGGAWHACNRPVVVPAGPHSVEYRAVDKAWNASAVRTLTTS